MHPSWGMSPWPQQSLPSLLEMGSAWGCSTFSTSPKTVGLVLLKPKVPSVGEVLLQLIRAEQPGSISWK